MMRFLAAALLAVLLPVQGYAAACAQICAVTRGEEGRVAAMSAGGDEDGHGHCEKQGRESAPAHGDGETSTLGAGKCCQAHVFAIDQAPPMSSSDPPAFARTSFVARWTNFIPEEPSPPPIAGVTDA